MQSDSISFGTTKPMDYLHHSGEDFLTHMNGLSGQPFTTLTDGAAIIRQTATNEKQILLLKRTEDEEYYPGVYEMPGGNYEPEDLTIRAALRREIQEETGLTMTRVVKELPQFTYTTQKKVIHLSYTVETEGEFAPNSEEHSTGDWFTKEEIVGVGMTDEMRALVLEALGEAILSEA